jgi:pyruvate,water dikinase
MNIVKKLFKKTEGKSDTERNNFLYLKNKFSYFMNLLELNNSILERISDIEEKSQGDFVFDQNYVIKSINELNSRMNEIVSIFNRFSNKWQSVINRALSDIQGNINYKAFGKTPIQVSALIMPLENISQSDYLKVGNKNANLGELNRIPGINVPFGFAITAWAYRCFINTNNLQDKISTVLNNSAIKTYHDLENIASMINLYVSESIIPEEIASEIEKVVKELSHKCRCNQFSVRSSAIGEDSNISFAGQYSSFLGVYGFEIKDNIKKVIASKFSPKAIYYYIGHGLEESDLPMSVGCYEMINARSAGVIYTSDPVNPDGKTIIINSVKGLGNLLVDGTIDPDYYCLDKSTGRIIESKIQEQEVYASLNKDGGISIKPNDKKQDSGSLKEADSINLYQAALLIESHFGCPQDIEWAIDDNDKLYILQSRPLVVYRKTPSSEPDLSGMKYFASGGITASIGAGAGPVINIRNEKDFQKIGKEEIIVVEHPFPGLAAIIKDCSALICKTGGIANHLVTIAREYRIPTIVGFQDIDIFRDGMEITVDADNQTIYSGIYPEFVKALRSKPDDTKPELALDNLLQIKPLISSLNLIDPDSPDFLPEYCKSYHDLVRFIHQKSMEEMFSTSIGSYRKGIGIKLNTELPFIIDIIDIDMEDLSIYKNQINEKEIESAPFKAFWEGVIVEGWKSPPELPNLKSFFNVISTEMTTSNSSQMSERSYAIINKEYMVLNLKMGYHFSTIESMCSRYTNRNYIKMTFKEGGAAIENRIRRIKILSDLLNSMGLNVRIKSDFLTANIDYPAYNDCREILKKIGRLTMMTRQLDITLVDTEAMHNSLSELNDKLGLKV